MRYKSKIRLSIGWIYPIGILSSYIIAAVEWTIRRHLMENGNYINPVPFVTFSVVSLFFIVLGIIQLVRYRSWLYPVLGFLIGFATFQASFAMQHRSGLIIETYFITIILIILFVVISWRSLYSQERFEINSRRLFRLASERLYETDDGFTERPYVAGKVEFTRDELLGFVRFLHGSYVIRPFYFGNYVAMAFSMNTSLLVIREHSQVSHVILDHNGQITVKISEKDYRDFRERLSFDQLCSSMATVFSRFLSYYKEGLESRIITELKSAK